MSERCRNCGQPVTPANAERSCWAHTGTPATGGAPYWTCIDTRGDGDAAHYAQGEPR